MTAAEEPTEHRPPEGRSINAHLLELERVELSGADRNIHFHSGFNIIFGDITTGKTTLVRLIRALLGTMPSALAPEVGYISAITGMVTVGGHQWQIYRPRTTSPGALVEISELYPDANREALSFRLPVAGSSRSYSTFLLDQLKIPVVSVPTARSEPTGNLSPVTMTDWLGYCIITGDELDTQVFGHLRTWRDLKRRWIFELVYGYYNPELAMLNAKLRSIDLQISALAQEAAVMEKFLAETPFAQARALEVQLEARQKELDEVVKRRRNISSGVAASIPGVQKVRQALLSARTMRSEITERIARIESQITDLTDLHRQLSSQSARLTRAIVADEWLVDYDFVVCPRCGNDVHAGRIGPDKCYLCLQPPRPAPSQDEMLAEQDRVTSQVDETTDIIEARRTTREQLLREAAELDGIINRYASELNQLTEAFISDNAAQIENQAAEQARLESEITRLQEYRELVRRHQMQLRDRAELEAQYEEVTAEVQGRELSQVDAEGNIEALEDRILEYLHELNIPNLGQELSVKINRANYLPEVSGRTFDELSSQGLKTLVNIAHALAHHTVAIDRNLPLPGLLILDGLSANAGHEGFDQERVRDVYRLLKRVTDQYGQSLQVIAVDNLLAKDLLLEFINYNVLTLTQADRLIRVPS
jgi:hypothetical protein